MAVLAAMNHELLMHGSMDGPYMQSSHALNSNRRRPVYKQTHASPLPDIDTEWMLAIAGCSLAGILAVMHSALDMKATLTGKHPHLLYLLASALRPRMLMTLDEEGKMLPVPVRVGQAVDTVAQVRRRSNTTQVLKDGGVTWLFMAYS